MYKVRNIRAAFGQSSASGSSDNEWTCATAYIYKESVPAWNENSSWNRNWSRGDTDHSSGTGNGLPLSHMPTLRIHVTLQTHLTDIFTNT